MQLEWHKLKSQAWELFWNVLDACVTFTAQVMGFMEDTSLMWHIRFPYGKSPGY